MNKKGKIIFGAALLVIVSISTAHAQYEKELMVLKSKLTGDGPSILQRAVDFLKECKIEFAQNPTNDICAVDYAYPPGHEYFKRDARTDAYRRACTLLSEWIKDKKYSAECTEKEKMKEQARVDEERKKGEAEKERQEIRAKYVEEARKEAEKVEKKKRQDEEIAKKEHKEKISSFEFTPADIENELSPCPVGLDEFEIRRCRLKKVARWRKLANTTIRISKVGAEFLNAYDFTKQRFMIATTAGLRNETTGVIAGGMRGWRFVTFFAPTTGLSVSNPELIYRQLKPFVIPVAIPTTEAEKWKLANDGQLVFDFVGNFVSSWHYSNAGEFRRARPFRNEKQIPPPRTDTVAAFVDGFNTGARPMEGLVFAVKGWRLRNSSSGSVLCGSLGGDNARPKAGLSSSRPVGPAGSSTDVTGAASSQPTELGGSIDAPSMVSTPNGRKASDDTAFTPKYLVSRMAGCGSSSEFEKRRCEQANLSFWTRLASTGIKIFNHPAEIQGQYDFKKQVFVIRGDGILAMTQGYWRMIALSTPTQDPRQPTRALFAPCKITLHIPVSEAEQWKKAHGSSLAFLLIGKLTKAWVSGFRGFSLSVRTGTVKKYFINTFTKSIKGMPGCGAVFDAKKWILYDTQTREILAAEPKTLRSQIDVQCKVCDEAERKARASEAQQTEEE